MKLQQSKTLKNTVNITEWVIWAGGPYHPKTTVHITRCS